MRCLACSFENRPGARYCGGCAAPLGATVACAECGTVNPAGPKFCDGCGRVLAPAAEGTLARDPRAYTPAHLAERILTMRSALEGERKQVTVLFADVQGSMELAESVDAEEWHRVLDRFFAILSDGIHRFEGTINQFTGDGVMALFGAPIAHEDHARRACHAALAVSEGIAGYARELRRTRGLNFSVRMGLNSGEVVVGKIGDDLRMDYTAQGRTVGLAARVEQLAASDRIYLTDATAALVSGYFRLSDLGEFAIKGVRDPVRVYDLQGVGPMRTRLELSQARGFSRLVGRHLESRALDEALERGGEIVALVADAGVGKSRLTHEFAERCRARGIAVYAGHGVPYGRSVPFLPVLELLRSYFSITERDSDDEARKKVAGTLVLLDEAFQESLALIFEFLGIGDPARPAPRLDPQTRDRQMLGFVRRMLRARGRREPAVLVFEDMHWMDGASDAFVANLAEAVPGTRTLLLANFRPDYSAPWLASPHCRVVPLAPLGAQATGELLADLLGDDLSLREIAERVGERTGGNPFFVEEVVRSLAETGVLEGRRGAYRLSRDPGELRVPPTVQAILAARIDRLPEEEKGVLQIAAVIGKEFSLPVLACVCGRHGIELEARLHRLAAAELVDEHDAFPGGQYAFRHPLTQEVAYHSQLSEQRAATHGSVARALVRLCPDKVDEVAGLVAHHWESAEEILEAARWTRRAAEWAETRNAGEAMRHWRKVRGLAREAPESLEALRLGVLSRARLIALGVWHGDPHSEAASFFAEGKALAERLDDARSLALLEAAYSSALTSAGDLPAAIEHTLEGVRLAELSGDEAAKLALRVPLVYAYEAADQIDEALALADATLAHPPQDLRLGASALGFSPYAFLALMRGELLTHRGPLGEARRQLEAALTIARELDEPEILGLAHGFFCYFARCYGDPETARKHAPQAMQIAEKLGSSLSRALACRGLGLAHLMSKEWAPAVAALEASVEIARESRTVIWLEPYSQANLAEAYLGLGRGEEARETARRSLRTAERLRQASSESHARVTLAHVMLAIDGPAAAEDVEASLDHALRQAGRSGHVSYLPHVHLAYAELARLLGQEDRRHAELREAARLFREIGAACYLHAVERELAGGSLRLGIEASS
jgi:class 3 adenylate cyclase